MPSGTFLLEYVCFFPNMAHEPNFACSEVPQLLLLCSKLESYKHIGFIFRTSYFSPIIIMLFHTSKLKFCFHMCGTWWYRSKVLHSHTKDHGFETGWIQHEFSLSLLCSSRLNKVKILWWLSGPYFSSESMSSCPVSLPTVISIIKWIRAEAFLRSW